MKKLIFTAAVVVACFLCKTADAQMGFGIGINIGNQPDWGPVGYHHARYYYMPDADVYYDVNVHQYVYFEDGKWTHAAALPPRYANFDRYHMYKAVVNQHNPWEHQADMQAKYAAYKGNTVQRNIRDAHDFHYRNHWKEGGDKH